MWPFADKSKALLRQRDALALEVEIADLGARLTQNNTPGFGSTATVSIGDPLAWDKLFGDRSDTISPQRALSHGAVYRCVFLIAGTIAALDFNSFQDAGTSAEERETISPQARLIGERPNPRYSRIAFWRSVVADMLLSGNAVVWIERNRAGTPLNLWWIPWNRVGVDLYRTAFGAIELRYHLTLDHGETIVAAQDDVMHFGGSHEWNLICFHSPMTSYALSIGLALSSDRYAKAYFDNGVSADTVIAFQTNKTADQAGAIRDAIKRQLGANNRFNGPLVLDGAAKVEQLKINATDAQLLESRSFNTSTIGMLFGVPGHLLNETSKATSFGKGLEELTQAFIDFTLGPHLAMIEDEVNWKLYGNRTRRARYDRDSFIRGDLKSRSEALQTLLGGAQGPGAISQNEARSRVGLPKRANPQNDELLSWPASPKADPAAADAAPAPSPAPAGDPAPLAKG